MSSMFANGEQDLMKHSLGCDLSPKWLALVELSPFVLEKVLTLFAVNAEFDVVDLEFFESLPMFVEWKTREKRILMTLLLHGFAKPQKVGE